VNEVVVVVVVVFLVAVPAVAVVVVVLINVGKLLFIYISHYNIFKSFTNNEN